MHRKQNGLNNLVIMRFNCNSLDGTVLEVQDANGESICSLTTKKRMGIGCIEMMTVVLNADQMLEMAYTLMSVARTMRRMEDEE